MKKFVCMMVVFVMAVMSYTCIAEGYRYETDERVSYTVILPEHGTACEYIELGEAFTFQIDHYEDGTASLIIWRHVDGLDAEWLNYFCTSHMEMEDTAYMRGLRYITEENLDFCLDTMDRHGWM